MAEGREGDAEVCLISPEAGRLVGQRGARRLKSCRKYNNVWFKTTYLPEILQKIQQFEAQNCQPVRILAKSTTMWVHNRQTAKNLAKSTTIPDLKVTILQYSRSYRKSSYNFTQSRLSGAYRVESVLNFHLQLQIIFSSKFLLKFS
ncbi:hypothetical protein P40081_06875 [Paenibacillus sp. FSL P4-0081]|nr:hypothetical protein P40081_06875 [Paenibacillus sp. FSL P4-0081]